MPKELQSPKMSKITRNCRISINVKKSQMVEKRLKMCHKWSKTGQFQNCPKMGKIIKKMLDLPKWGLIDWNILHLWNLKSNWKITETRDENEWESNDGGCDRAGVHDGLCSLASKLPFF